MAFELVPPSDLSRADARESMYALLSTANDPSQPMDTRYYNLQRAGQFAEDLRKRGETVPEALSDPANMRRTLRSYGLAALSEYQHDMNASPSADFNKRGGFADKARRMINAMQQDGILSEEEGYRMFGGKEALDNAGKPLPGQVAVAMPRPDDKAALEPRPGDKATGTNSPAAQGVLNKLTDMLNDFKKNQDKVYEAMPGAHKIMENCWDATDPTDVSSQIVGSGCPAPPKRIPASPAQLKDHLSRS